MLNMNRATLLGHAGRDPELRDLGNGGRAAAFTLATTEKWTDREGRPAEATEWHRIVVYGPTVAAVEAMLRKGDRVMVEGPHRHPRIPRPGGRGPVGDRNRRRRQAGPGQRALGAAGGSRTGFRGAGMSRRFAPLAALALLAVLWAAPASAQTCTGRFVNPISDVCWECICSRSRSGRSPSAASRACSTRRTRPRRSASAARRSPASASRSGSGSRRGWSTRRGRPGASPISAASP